MARKPRITLVTGWTDPERRSIVEFATKILRTLAPFSESLTWLATNLSKKVHIDNNTNLIRVESKYLPRRASPLKLVPYMLLYQLKISRAILKILPTTDIFIFATGSDLSFIPMLLVKLARKKILLRSEGRPSVVVEKYIKGQSKAKIWLIRPIEALSYSLAERILPEMGNFVELYRMQKYRRKMSIASQYVDTSIFKETQKPSERQYDVGYIGRLIKEKGALEFSQSLPMILKGRPSQAIIIGDGYMRDEIEDIIASHGIQTRVKLLNWIDNKELPYYLNDIKLVVVPSDYEGLSTLILEAMACGTMVLATPVGGTPEVVHDGETGFILENNSPECIAANAARILNYADIDHIRNNARTLIERVYSYQAAVERFKDIFNIIGFNHQH
jgi:glycosyltransferase involved in cell wall biosynthesis